MQAKFVGRWVPSGNSMTTGYPGSSFSFKVNGTSYVNVSISGATRIAYKVDNEAYVVTNNVQITGLTLSEHTIKIVLTTSIQTWAGNNYAQITGIEVASGGSILIEPATKRKCLVFGDSITEGNNASGQGLSASECTWWNKLGDMLNMDVTPVGIGGIGYVSALTQSADYPSVVSNPSYIENVTEIMTVSDTDYDLVIIELGTNDYKSKTDVDNAYVTNVTSVVNRIKAKYPNADIHALIPFTLNGQPSLNQAYGNTNVDIIPTSWYSSITFADAFHPNEAGNATIANNVKNYFLNKYGESYFKEVTMKRIDSIYIDTNGAVQKATGTMADNPVKPTLPAGAIKVADVLVEQGTSTGTVVDKRDYVQKPIKPNGFFLATFFNFVDSSRTSKITQFYASLDGVNWKHINKDVTLGEIPVSGGDPSLAYYNGVFYVAVSDQSSTTYDFTLYRSTDLKTWSIHHISLGLPASTDYGWRNVWAPDLFIDNDGTMYVFIAFQESTASKFDIYISKCIDISTLTFETAQKITLWNGTDTTNLSTDRSHIDATVEYHDGYYYMAVKNEAVVKVEIFKSTNLYTGWQKIKDSVFVDNIEGPCIRYVNGRWHFWADVFSSKSLYGQSEYVHSVSDDLMTFVDWQTLSHNNSTFMKNLRHGSIIYIDNDNVKAQKIIRGLPDFEVTEEEQYYMAGGLGNTQNGFTQTLIDETNGDQSVPITVNTLVLYPHWKFMVFRPAIIENIINPLGVNNVTFSFTNSYSEFLHIKKIDNVVVDYVSSPSRNDLFAMKLEKRNSQTENGETQLVRTDVNNTYLMTSGNAPEGSKYVKLFDITVSNFATATVIFELTDIAIENYDGIYHIAVHRTDHTGTPAAKATLLHNFKTTTQHLYGVLLSDNDTISIYADMPWEGHVYQMTILSAATWGGNEYVKVARPWTLESDLTTIGTVTQLL